MPRTALRSPSLASSVGDRVEHVWEIVDVDRVHRQTVIVRCPHHRAQVQGNLLGVAECLIQIVQQLLHVEPPCHMRN